MNEYGRLAMSHWEKFLPGRFSQLEDPRGFFTDLGEQVAQQVVETTIQLEAAESFDPDYLTQVGQRNALQAQARELVLADLVFLPSEEDEPEPMVDHPAIGADGMPVDLSHPLWGDLEDDEISPEQFRERLTAWWATLEPTTAS